MKIFDPTQKSGRQIDLQGVVPKRHFLKSLLHSCHGNIRCLLAPQTLILNSEAAVKSAKYKTISLVY